MGSDFVTLMTFSKVQEAEVKRLLLEDEGIKTYLSDAEIVAMDWLLGNAVGEIKLQVANADVERAVTILKNAPPISTDAPRQENECLACGTAMAENEDVCSNCGWTYE